MFPLTPMPHCFVLVEQTGIEPVPRDFQSPAQTTYATAQLIWNSQDGFFTLMDVSFVCCNHPNTVLVGVLRFELRMPVRDAGS